MKFNKLGHIAAKATEGRIAIVRAAWPPIPRWQDTIELDEDKIVITRKSFGFKKIVPLKLEDLLNVEIMAAPIFCTVRVIGKFVTGGFEDVSYILKKDAYAFQKKALELVIDKTSNDSSGGQ